jgi:hypothetical protein
MGDNLEEVLDLWSAGNQLDGVADKLKYETTKR